MNLAISKCVRAVILSNFSGHYLRNRSTLDTGVLGCIGIVQHKEHSPEVLSIPPGTPSNQDTIYRGADKSLARPTPNVFFFMVRVFLLILVLYIYI